MPPGWEFERAAGIVVWTGDPTPSDRSSSLGIAGGRRTRPFMEQARGPPPPSEYKRLCCWDRLATVVHIETDD